METEYQINVTLAQEFVEKAAAFVGDGRYVVRILNRAIASLQKELGREKKERCLNGEWDDHANSRMSLRAVKTLEGILDSLDFTFNAKQEIYDLYADKNSRPRFTPYAKTVIQRTYSGEKEDSGMHETWADIVVRVIETIFYFRKVQLLSVEHPTRPHSVFSAEWDESYEQALARAMALSMYRVEWLPPGRGLQMCRKKLVRERGSMILNNCGATTTGYYEAAPDDPDPKKSKLEYYNETKKIHPYGIPEQRLVFRERAIESFLNSMDWGAVALMSGVGVGFDAHFNLLLEEPNPSSIETYVVPDTREGWAYSIRLLLASYLYKNSRTVHFNYDKVRPKGTLIKSFGGVASGPGALRLCHERIRASCRCLLKCQRSSREVDDREAIAEMLRERLPHEITFLEEEDASLVEAKKATFAFWIEQTLNSPYWLTYGTSRAVVDWCNFMGVCVRMGNLRRSAEIVLGSPDDCEFAEVKDYNKHPERIDVGNTSNNSIQLFDESQYNKAAETLSQVVGVAGEPGIVNMVHIWEKPKIIPSLDPEMDDIELVCDTAELINPCGETPLEPYELCDLVETFPCNCASNESWLAACRYATLFASITTCIPTASEATNRVIDRNHRIGVSQTGLFHFYEKCSSGAEYESKLRAAYQTIRRTADAYVKKITGVKPIRCTTVKPSGTIAPLGNAPPGIHPPIESRYVIRRIRIARNLPISAILIAKGIPYEVDVYDPTAYVFDFVLDQGEMRNASHVTSWELGALVMATQEHYADLAVSVSLYLDEHADTPQQIFAYLKRYLHKIKSISFMPRSTKKALALTNGATVFFPLYDDHQPLLERLQTPPSITEEMLAKCSVLFPLLQNVLNVAREVQVVRDAISEEQLMEVSEKAPEMIPILSYIKATPFVHSDTVKTFSQKRRAPYPQRPYEDISKEVYESMAALVEDLDFDGTPFLLGEQELIQGCDGLSCSRA